jgi:hypothetical protein
MITTKIRADVLARDDYTCWYCPRPADTVDHVIPRTRYIGPDVDAPHNLIAACREDNSGLSATPPTRALIEEVRQKQARWDTERPQRVSKVTEIITAWPRQLRPNNQIIARQVNEWLYWMPLQRLLRETKGIPLDDLSSPPWNRLHGIANRIKYELHNTHDWSTNGELVQRWNDLQQIVKLEFEEVRRKIARLEQKQLQMEKYLLGDDEQ